MVFQFVVDFFNYDFNCGCLVVFDVNDYMIMMKYVYEFGDEVFIQYGNYLNDMFFVEYGFIFFVGVNCWDEIIFDVYFCLCFFIVQKSKLEEVGFWVGYKFDVDIFVCY